MIVSDGSSPKPRQTLLPQKIFQKTLLLYLVKGSVNALPTPDAAPITADCVIS